MCLLLFHVVGDVSPLSEHLKGRTVKVFEFSVENGQSASAKQGVVLEIYVSKFEGANGGSSVALVRYDDETTELVDLRQGRVYPLDGESLPVDPFRNLWFDPAPPKQPETPKTQYYHTTPFKVTSSKQHARGLLRNDSELGKRETTKKSSWFAKKRSGGRGQGDGLKGWDREDDPQSQPVRRASWRDNVRSLVGLRT